LSAGVVIVPYDEKAFEAGLRMQAAALLKQRMRPAGEQEGEGALRLQVDELNERLRELESRRAGERERSEAHFRDSVEALAKPAIQERRLETRREVVDALDTLRERLLAGDLLAEQQVMRSILIANEAYLHNRDLDDLGDAYLEAVSVERMGLPGDVVRDVRDIRFGLIHDMHRSVRRPTIVSVLAGRQRRFALTAAWSLVVLAVTYVIRELLTYRISIDGTLSPDNAEYAYWLAIVGTISLLLAAPLILVMVVVWFLDRWRRNRLRWRLRAQMPVEARYPRPSIRDTYPQAPR
jgi:hypothetical protein